MLKRIYNRYKGTQWDDNKTVLEVADIKEFKDYMKFIIPGSKLKWRGEKKRYTCIARTDNFIIVQKPYNLRKGYDGEKMVMYSILDLTQMRCNRDNLVFGMYDYGKLEDCQEALEALEMGLIPYEERPKQKVDAEIEEITGCPYRDAETLEISHRGIADIKDIIEEIWIDMKRTM